MHNKKYNKARQYKPTTVRKLDTLSGNQCYSPDCEKFLIAKDGETITSKICHIEAASPNGARYNSSMNDDERRHFNNLILLCDECHLIIDNKINESKYPVLLLQEWKRSHESKRLEKLNSNPSLLKIAINAIAEANFETSEAIDSSSLNPFKIDQKLEYNLIKRNRYLIEEYKIYYTKISALYQELDAQGSFKKDKLLRNIRKLYLKTKGKYVNDAKDIMAAIRENSDSIIEDIEEELLKSCESSNQFSEDVAFAISIVLVDAFMRCKILEEPT